MVLKKVFSVFLEVFLCLVTYIIPPITIMTGVICQNIVFWAILLQQSWGFNVQKIKVWSKYAACWYWKIFSKIWHGHEIIGKTLKTMKCV